jgi:hypothetical protein
MIKTKWVAVDPSPESRAEIIARFVRGHTGTVQSKQCRLTLADTRTSTQGGKISIIAHCGNRVAKSTFRLRKRSPWRLSA